MESAHLPRNVMQQFEQADGHCGPQGISGMHQYAIDVLNKVSR
jgi:hypothetical protein